MGTLIGHVLPGYGFFIIGLWHLLNNIKLHVLNPKSYKSKPWFPARKFKYFELWLLIAGCTTFLVMELFVSPEKHHPLDTDGTIPSNHLHNIEHANIALAIMVYATLVLILEKLMPRAPAKYGLMMLLAAVAFGVELFLFHLHSADHMGVEGQYHWLLQIVIFFSFLTTLLGIPYQKSFLNSFVRSFSILFQGLWLIVMGFMLWNPSLVPKGCFIRWEDGHQVVRCHAHEELERAKSLVNISFTWYLLGATVFAVTLYMMIVHFYSSQGKVEYELLLLGDQEEEEDDDVEAQKRSKSMFFK